MNTETITSKIHAQADSELAERLHKAFYAIRHEFSDGCCKGIQVRGGYIEGQCNGEESFYVDAHEALKALETLSFEMQRHKNREKKTNDFIDKVKRIVGELEELKGLV
jgi:hypothetical protein